MDNVVDELRYQCGQLAQGHSSSLRQERSNGTKDSGMYKITQTCCAVAMWMHDGDTGYRVSLYNGQWSCCRRILTHLYYILQMAFPGHEGLCLSCMNASVPLSKIHSTPCKVTVHNICTSCFHTQQTIPVEEPGAVQYGDLATGKWHCPRSPHTRSQIENGKKL